MSFTQKNRFVDAGMGRSKTADAGYMQSIRESADRFAGAGSGLADTLKRVNETYKNVFNTSFTSPISNQQPASPFSNIARFQKNLSAWQQPAAADPFAGSVESLLSKWQSSLDQGSTQKPIASGGMSSLGGDWSGVDQWNDQIAAAANKYGVPANLMKAVMQLESGGANLAANGAGAVGPMQVVASIWNGLGYDLSDPAQNIMAGAAILKQNYDQFSGWAQQNGVDPWKAAVYSYYAGSPYDLTAADSVAQGGSGMSTGAYGDQIWNSYQSLNSTSTVGYQQTGSNSTTGNSVVSMALQYVGQVPYVWGGIPGKGQDPYAAGGGWDCSGFTYWLNQNYGDGALPAGSHYQFQYAQQTGQLFSNTGGLQPGDLLFFDTGNTAGGGAELNRAGHVAMYIGNGQMMHAANPDAGTIVSSLNDYMNMYGFLGAMHQSFSGGGAGTGSTGAPSVAGHGDPWASVRRSASQVATWNPRGR